MASTISHLDKAEHHRSRRDGKPIIEARILGIGSYAPENVVLNEDLSQLGFDANWILQRTGIEQRRHALPEMATSDIAYQAAQNAIADADLSTDDIDLIIVATLTPDHLTPSTACLVQSMLGSTAPAFDINAACAGFMYAMITGSQFIASGAYRRILVIGADVMSRVVNPEDKKTYPLFGDGGGAVILGHAEELTDDAAEGVADAPGVLSFILGADGDGAALLRIPGGGSRQPACQAMIDSKHQFLQMEGKAVFKWAVRLISDTTQKLLQDAQLKADDIDLVVLHQANMRIIDAAVEGMGVPREKIFVNLDRYGNTSAGSIPLALDEAFRTGRIERGSKVLLSGFGAGLAWGACIIRL